MVWYSKNGGAVAIIARYIMDFSKFTDDNFDAKEWVNAALKAKKDDQTSVDVRT